MLAENQILADRDLLLDRLSDKTGRQTWKAIALFSGIFKESLTKE